MQQRPISLLLLAYVALAVAFNVTVGVGETPDEAAHVAYIRHIIEYRALPLQFRDPAHYASHQAHQPPAYYTLGALLTFWIDPGNYRLEENPSFDITPGRVWARQRYYHTDAEGFPYRGTVLAYHLLRAFSTVLGAITVWAVWQAARIVAPQRQAVALLAAGLTAFNPQFIFLTASVNNDNLAIAVASLMLLAGLAAWRKPSFRLTVVVGLLIGLAALSKYTALAAAPGALLALGAPYVRQRHWRALMGHLALAGGLAALVSGWWFVQNWWLHGDPLAQHIALHALAGVRRYNPWRLKELPGNLVSAFTSSWARFGWMNIIVHPAIYWTLASLCATALAGVLRIAWHAARERRLWRWETVPPLSLALAGLGVIAFVVRYHLIVPADHGRLFFPAISAFAIWMALGLLAWAGRWQAQVAGGIMAGLAALSASCLVWVLAPAFAQPRMLAEADLRISHRLAARYGEGIALRGFDVAPRGLRPGQSFDVTLYWQALQRIDTNYWLLIQLLDPSGRPLAHMTSLPYLGRYATVLWRPGDLFADRYTLTVVPDAWPGAATLAVVFDTPDAAPPDAEWTLDNQSMGERLELATLKIESTAQSVYHPENRASVRLGDVARLTGYDPTALSVRAGQTLTTTLYWQALRATQNDYHVFVHLICSGQLVAQDDNVPGRGWFPSAIWAAGDVIRDEHQIELPPDTPAGACTLSAGLYNFDTGDRLPATDASGQRLADDRAVLAHLDILP